MDLYLNNEKAVILNCSLSINDIISQYEYYYPSSNNYSLIRKVEYWPITNVMTPDVIKYL